MIFETHEEKREYVRYPCDLAVKIFDRAEKSYLSESCDLSEKGICLLVSASQAAELMNAACQLKTGDTIKIGVPDAKAQQERTIVCSVSHSATMAQGQTIIGLCFEDNRQETRDFILELLAQYR